LSIRIRVLGVFESLLHRGFLVGKLLRVIGLHDPARQGVRHGVHRRARRGLYRDGDLHDARLLSRHRADAIDIVALIVVLFIADFIHGVPAGSNAVHFRLGIELGHRQVAGLGRAAGPDANKLPDHGQSAPQDGDRQDHFHQRQTALGGGAHEEHGVSA
jgi:hypothetical protein